MKTKSARIFFIFIFCLAIILIVSCNRIPKFSGDSAYTHLVKQCDLGPRNPGSKTIELCRSYIEEVLQSNGALVKKQIFTEEIKGQTYQGVNIIGQFYPRLSRRILLGAHYDTRPWADKEEDRTLHIQPILGANDAASGVGVLLELSRLLGYQAPEQYGVDLVFFDLEDMGDYGINETWALGSSYFANNWENPDYEKALVIDMIGDKDLEIEMEYFSYHNSPQLVNEVWQIASDEGITEFQQAITKAIYDDHYPLIAAGYNAVDIIDFDYKYWHTLNDTPDKCSSQSLEKVGKVLVNLIYKER